MLRIAQGDTGDGYVTLRFEGELVGPWVAETRRFCDTLSGDGEKLRLDLTDVSLADRLGVELLAELKNSDAVLENCSPFLAAQLRSARL